MSPVTFRRIFNRILQIKMTEIGWALFFLVTSSSLIVNYLEPEKFKTPLEGLYFTLVTLSTTGYGDFYPSTTPGRLWTMFLIVFGGIIYLMVIGKAVDILVDLKQRRVEGRVDYKGKNHVVIIGWSRYANITANVFIDRLEGDVVLVDDKVEKIPIDDKSNFFFIKGVPSRDKVLERANIKDARQILIFAEEKIKYDSPYDADARTAFIASSVERLAPQVPTKAEIILEENIPNFRRANPDIEIRLSGETFASTMYNE